MKEAQTMETRAVTVSAQTLEASIEALTKSMSDTKEYHTKLFEEIPTKSKTYK